MKFVKSYLSKRDSLHSFVGYGSGYNILSVHRHDQGLGITRPRSGDLIRVESSVEVSICKVECFVELSICEQQAC